MNLTWHIVLKDLRRLKLGLALWTLLIIGQIFMAERMFSAAAFEPGWFDRQQLTFLLTLFVGYVFAFFLSAAIVLEDSLVGTRMFWVTRPISGGRLLAAKSLAVFLAVILWPLALALPWWIYCGFSFDQLLSAIGFVMLADGIIALLAVTLAALAGEGSRFLVWTLTLLIALPMLIGIITNRSEAFAPTDVATSRTILTIMVVALAALAVIWIQFRTRRVGRALVVIAGGAGLAVLVMAAWPWNIVQFWPRDTRQRAGTEEIKVELVSTTIHEPTLGRATVVLRFRAKDLPPDFTFLPSGRVEATFVWPDGATFQNAGTIQSGRWKVPVRSLLHLPEEQRDPETVRKLEELAVSGQKRTWQPGEPGRPEQDSAEFSGVIPISPYWAERFLAKPPASCTVRLRVETRQPEVLLEMPWRDGTVRTPDGVRLKQVRMDHTKMGSMKGSVAKANAIMLISRPTSVEDIQFFFVNRSDGREAFVSVGGPTTPVRSAVMPVRYDLRWAAATPPKVWRTDQWVQMPGWEEWLESSSLVLVTFKEDGGFNREITTDRLVVGR